MILLIAAIILLLVVADELTAPQVRVRQSRHSYQRHIFNK